jgi:uncharacterized OB-fold protein
MQPAVQPFYDALRDGELMLAYCGACQRFDLPGVRTCPECLSHDLQWRRASGRGSVFSFVVFRRELHPAFAVPYAVCVVELEEGPRLVAALTGVEPGAVETGTPVVTAFGEDAGGDPEIPIRFTPRQEPSA